MTKMNKIALAIATTLFAGSVSAASLNIREEIKENGDTGGRVKISGGSGNHYFGVEMKHTGLFDIKNLETTQNEFEYGYNWKVNSQWRFQTAMPITLSSNNTTYKPQVRAIYTADNGLQTKLRYRHEFRHYSGDNTTTGRDGEQYSDLNRSKITFNLDYKAGNFPLGFEANYAEDFFNEQWRSGNEEDSKYEWDAMIKAGYNIPGTAWRPFAELANVQNSDAEPGARQARFRVGVNYSF